MTIDKIPDIKPENALLRVLHPHLLCFKIQIQMSQPNSKTTSLPNSI